MTDNTPSTSTSNLVEPVPPKIYWIWGKGAKAPDGTYWMGSISDPSYNEDDVIYEDLVPHFMSKENLVKKFVFPLIGKIPKRIYVTSLYTPGDILDLFQKRGEDLGNIWKWVVSVQEMKEGEESKKRDRPLKKPDIYWWWGPPATGKTYKVINIHGKKNIWIPSSMDKGGTYEGQTNILLDNVSSLSPLSSHISSIIEGDWDSIYPEAVKSLGTNNWNIERVYIISRGSPGKYFNTKGVPIPHNFFTSIKEIKRFDLKPPEVYWWWGEGSHRKVNDVKGRTVSYYSVGVGSLDWMTDDEDDKPPLRKRAYDGEDVLIIYINYPDILPSFLRFLINPEGVVTHKGPRKIYISSNRPPAEEDRKLFENIVEQVRFP